MGLYIGETYLEKESSFYFVAEIGINHNGDIKIAKKLIDMAVRAGCDAVKFQKRNPDICVPEAQKSILRETPWGILPYIEYRKRMEFGKEEFDVIDAYCRSKKIQWFASCWDLDSLDFILQYETPAFKVASASLTNLPLLKRLSRENKPVILSTGMSSQEEVEVAVAKFDKQKLILCHSVSSYPAPVDELNLKMLSVYAQQYPEVILGYSGHEVGLPTTYAAAALGAVYIERHITLDRTMWGTDQAASVEFNGLKDLADKIKVIKRALGTGVKNVMPSELSIREKLRKAF